MTERPIDTSAEQSRADSRRRVLQAVRAFPGGCGVQQVAERTGLHPNTVRFHLDRLEDERLISRQARRSGERGRPPLAYTADPVPDAGGGHRDFARLAEVLAQLVARTNEDPAAAAIEAGRSWSLARPEELAGSAAAADAIDALIQALADVGFAPRISVDDGRTVVLHRHCPFLEVARTHQEVICSVHLGLMRGLLERLNAPVTVERLVPFAGPAGCEARLSPEGAGPGGAR